jgi:hypothetical protein
MALSWNEIRTRALAFTSEMQRIEYLFGLYKEYTEPLLEGEKKKGKK